MGRLEVICGPMYSGKTEELIRRLRRAEIGGKDVILAKPWVDRRYSEDHVVSHNGTKMPSMRIKKLRELAVLPHQVIGVDEIQFIQFLEDDLESLFSRGNLNRTIIVSGLDMTYRGEPFGQIGYLMAIAESVLKITAVCHKCGADAVMTQRLVDGKPASWDEETVQVGGLDSYEARCRSCWEFSWPGEAQVADTL